MAGPEGVEGWVGSQQTEPVLLSRFEVKWSKPRYRVDRTIAEPSPFIQNISSVIEEAFKSVIKKQLQLDAVTNELRRGRDSQLLEESSLKSGKLLLRRQALLQIHTADRVTLKVLLRCNPTTDYYLKKSNYYCLSS